MRREGGEHGLELNVDQISQILLKISREQILQISSDV